MEHPHLKILIDRATSQNQFTNAEVHALLKQAFEVGEAVGELKMCDKFLPMIDTLKAVVSHAQTNGKTMKVRRHRFATTNL